MTQTAPVTGDNGAAELTRRASQWAADAGVIYDDCLPIVLSLNPASTASGAGNVSVVVNGNASNDVRASTGFPPGSAVMVDGVQVSATQSTNSLTASVPKKATAGTKIITVQTPRGVVSDPLTLTFT